MKRKASASAWLTMAVVVLAAAGVAADTLYLRNGDEVRGQLVSIRNGEVEFREQRGWSPRTIRVNVDEVRRIDFDGGNYNDSGYDTGGGYGTSGRPSGMRERSVVVSADVPFVETGIEVRSGQTVYFRAQGQVSWGKGRRDGPDGEKNSPFNPNRPIPDRPGASFIGKIGEDSSDWFFIGSSEGGIRMRSSGRLCLGINDDVLDDNNGNFRVTVYY